MRPLAENSAKDHPAKSSGGEAAKPARFQNLAAALRRHGSSSSDPSPHGDRDDAGPTVETVVEEGVVKMIRVRCSCGEVIEIDCAYDA